MRERVNNLATIEAIAERCDVEVHLTTEAGGGLSACMGAAKTSRTCWGRLMAITFVGSGATLVTRHLTIEPDDTLVVSLYSGRTNWAEAGY